MTPATTMYDVRRDPLRPVLGAKSADALATTLGIGTVGALLRHYPRRYAERGQLTDIASLELGEHATVLARIVSAHRRPMRSRKGSILEVTITDGHCQLVCTFFRRTAWLAGRLQAGTTGLFAGKVSAYRRQLQLTHPEVELLPAVGDTAVDDAGAVKDFVNELIPVYPAAAGMPSWTIQRCVAQLLDSLEEIDDPLPGEVRAAGELLDLDTALRRIHRPADRAAVGSARRRLAWDEAMAVQLIFAQRRAAAGAAAAAPCPSVPGGALAAFDERLPFSLTAGQRDLGTTIAADLTASTPMNRLLQGEVGSGKTLVALRAMLHVVDAGKQAALLAPTEVLAAQHARSLAELLGPLASAGELGAPEAATRVQLLSGSLPAKQRKQALLDAASGAAGIVVGTHALIQEHVSFADLGLVVVDEQHRFGVDQRYALRTRGDATSPHVLVMTATPIPRTVAMTVYGDLDVSVLRELPQARTAVSTSVVPVAEKPGWLHRAWDRVGEEVARGHQVYVVCSHIGEDAEGAAAADAATGDAGADEPEAGTAQFDDAATGDAGADDTGAGVYSVRALAAELARERLAGLRIGVLHGKLAGAEKDAVMREFTAGEIDVLVATTVIEVGVDVANATMMVLMDAERFGISQLHQLRGRVGRGSAAGLCLLVTSAPEGSRSRRRLADVEATTDGFRLAELDLELRREGDILGAAQSGARSGLTMLSLREDADLIAGARTEAQRIIGEDPTLEDYPGLAALSAELVDPHGAAFLEKA